MIVNKVRSVYLNFYLNINHSYCFFLQGIGRRYSHVVCKKADVDLTKRAGELSEEEVRKCIAIFPFPNR